jgi:signal transduction histidine kinase
MKIRDNGPGISPEVRANLFQPFATTKAQGTGLGLSWVKRVIEEHGGRIECDYQGLEQEWQGAGFLIVLPSADAATEKTFPASLDFEGSTMSRMPEIILEERS